MRLFLLFESNLWLVVRKVIDPNGCRDIVLQRDKKKLIGLEMMEVEQFDKQTIRVSNGRWWFTMWTEWALIPYYSTPNSDQSTDGARRTRISTFNLTQEFESISILYSLFYVAHVYLILIHFFFFYTFFHLFIPFPPTPFHSQQLLSLSLSTTLEFPSLI